MKNFILSITAIASLAAIVGAHGGAFPVEYKQTIDLIGTIGAILSAWIATGPFKTKRGV